MTWIFAKITRLIAVSGIVCFAVTAVCAQDKINRKEGAPLEGRITGVSGGAVKITLASGSISLPLNQVASVEMKAPAALDQARNLAPAGQIATLEPLLESFKGLPGDWVVETMALVADAYSAQQNGAKAQAIYEEMARLYPGSRFLITANVGLAKNALQNNQPDEALRLLEPLIAQSNQKLYVIDAENMLYASAYLTQGQAYEQKNQLSEALASYVQITTIFYKNETLTKTATERAEKLRQVNPKLITP